MKRTLTILFVALVCATGLFAKEPQRPTSYKYQRALDALFEEQDSQKALDLLNAELNDHPKDGYSHVWIAHIRLQQEEYGRALTCANAAIKLLPRNDKEYRAFVYSIRAQVYENLCDTAQAVADWAQAIKLDPTDYRWYQNRGDLYFEQGKYALADADYQKMVCMDDNEAVIYGYMGLGRNLRDQSKHEEAIAMYNKVIQLYGDSYSSSYSFRAESELQLKRYEEAVNDIVKALEIDQDDKAFYMLVKLKETAAIDLMQQKLRLQTIFSPNLSIWHYYVGIFAEVNKDYRAAIQAYKKANSISHDKQVDERIASCYEDLGDYRAALKYINYAIESDTTDADNYYVRANFYAELGQIEKSVEEMTRYIEQNPRSYYGYYRRGWWKHLAGLCNEAIEDFILANAIDPTYIHTYDGMARCYLSLRDTAKGLAEYEKMLVIDTIPDGNSCAQYAYHFLGQDDKAIDWMESKLKQDSSEVYYDAACLYSLVGDTVKALYYLDQTLSNGFVRFHHIEIDSDLDNIRYLSTFRHIVDEHKQKVMSDMDAVSEEGNSVQRIVEVPFTIVNGVTKVDCSVNNLPLNFVFDTGASAVSLSQVEANFMFKNGYLSGKDVIGQTRYMTADGNVSEGTEVNLRQINFGGLELTNVRASVVKSQNAPLLLGQSVLQRLGKIEIDNERRVLKITTNN